MSDPPIVSRGFAGRRRDEPPPGRLPPGQYLTRDFPVLSAGPTPRVLRSGWDFRIQGAVSVPRRWSWEEFQALPREAVTADIHCVTQWSKLDTRWEGVALDTLLREVEPRGEWVTAFCDGGYTTSLPLGDLAGGRAWIVDRYRGERLPADHGGPARLLVPHLYFWKSAKWIRGLEFSVDHRPGFWEVNGYHPRGDPWREERYSEGGDGG